METKNENIPSMVCGFARVHALEKERTEKETPMHKGPRTMKPSGVDWIGEIPSDWKVERLKYIARSNIDSLGEDEEKNREIDYVDISSVSYENGIEKVQNLAFRNAPSRARRILHDGDTIISTVRTYLKAIAYVDEDHTGDIGSTGFSVLTPRSIIHPKFLYYALCNPSFISMVESNSVGISYPAITDVQLINLKIIIPSKEEQKRIANYLDEKCQAIDRAVQDIEKSIDALTAYKQSLITETVTHGLHKDVPMKDSGIDWIGEIPSDWKIKKIKYVTKNLDDRRKPIEASKRRQSAEKSYDYYGASGVIDQIDDYIFDHEDTLLIGEDGANLLLRNLPLVYIARGRYWVNNHAHILEPLVGNNILYLAYIMESADYYSAITGSAQPKLTQDNLGNIKLPIPSLEEQKWIAKYLDEKCQAIDCAIRAKRKLAETWRAYKASLIYEAVTGKIDLRS